MSKYILLVLMTLFLFSCSTVEYKGVSGTDQGKKILTKRNSDGTDYDKIFNDIFPKKKKTKTKTTTVVTTKKTEPVITTKKTPIVTPTTVTTEKVKFTAPNISDTKDFLFPIKSPVVKKNYKEGAYSGIDFTVGKSSDIFAVAPGMVIFSGEKASLGNALFIYHNNGYVSIYTGLEKLNFKKGDYINSTKDIVAKASSSFGFEFRKRTDEGTVPLDPNKFLKKRI